jgi:Nickel responsive protein SCO4226-like
MELVVVERTFEQPVQFEDIHALDGSASWCLSAHRVRFLKTLFSRDRRRMLCLYEAPDAEAVRRAEGEARATFDRAWTCAQLPIGSPGNQAPAAEYVVVERLFPEPVTPEFFANALREKGWCLDLHRAEYVEGYLATDGLRAVCVFRAPDAESVRLANNQAGVPYTKVWTASTHISG